MVTESLKHYIENEVFPRYSKNDYGHQLHHIQYVIERSLRFADEANMCMGMNINLDLVYTIAAYHDIGHHIDYKNHEVISAEIMIEDKNLQRWFSDEDIAIIYDAICDHRASSNKEPRSIYGKIVSSADRNTDIDAVLKRTHSFSLKHKTFSKLDEFLNHAYSHLKSKFGDGGYANGKIYFKDNEYALFLDELNELLNNRDKFNKKYIEINNLGALVLKQQLEDFIPWNEQEMADKKSMLLFIESFDDVITRNNIFGHFTASAFVINRSRTHALMLHHKIMNDYIYPGGHADGEYDLYSVALREVEEETGLKAKPMFDGKIFAIQCAPTKGHTKNGKYVSTHIHHDILFAFYVDDEEMDKIKIKDDENSSVEWWPITDTWSAPVVDWARPVNRKIVQKMGF